MSILVSSKNHKSNYLTDVYKLPNRYIDVRNYEDLLIEEDDFAEVATIQSKVIRAPYIKLFRVFDEDVENKIYQYHPSLKPKNDKRGYKANIIPIYSTTNKKRRDSLTRKYLEIFNTTHQVFIDSIQFDSNFFVTTDKRKKYGFETYINIKNLSEGNHLLRLKRLTKSKKDTIQRTDITIPFWYFKD